MTTVLVTAMVLVAVMFVVVVVTLALAARAHRRRHLDDARAAARHWVERLGGELLVLDGAAAPRLRTGTAAGLAEAAERFTAAGAELAVARTPRQCRMAQETAVEGLHHVRTTRRSLGLDLGPRVPGQSVCGVLRTALQDGGGSITRLVGDVLAEAHGHARQLPATTAEPVEWIYRGQQRRMRPESVRR